MPLVSVIMPVYNSERFLAEAVESILAQTFADFELLIVDDGSTDGSAEIARSYAAMDSRVRCLQLSENSGPAAARNRAIRAATGEYITPMDSDDISVAIRLQRQVDFLKANPEIGAVGGHGRAVSGEQKEFLYKLATPQSHAVCAMRIFYGDGFVQASIMFRREFLDAVGGYDTSLIGHEDLDLVLRLLFETEIRFANLQEEILIFRRHPNSTTTTRRQKVWMDSARLRHHALERLWKGPVEAATVDRFMALYRRVKLNWKDRRAAKRDLRRLIDALIHHSWVEPEDKTVLTNEMNRRLEQASPRRWQQFMNWRRHRLGL